MVLSENEKSKIIQELTSRIKKLKGSDIVCSVCSNNHFVLAEGYTRRILSDNVNVVPLDGLNIPSVTIICTHCGNTIDFALGTLGLLPENKEKKR
jgi:hypothetical protein